MQVPPIGPTWQDGPTVMHTWHHFDFSAELKNYKKMFRGMEVRQAAFSAARRHALPACSPSAGRGPLGSSTARQRPLLPWRTVSEEGSGFFMDFLIYIFLEYLDIFNWADKWDRVDPSSLACHVGPIGGIRMSV